MLCRHVLQVLTPGFSLRDVGPVMCRCFCSGCSEEVLSAVFQVFARGLVPDGPHLFKTDRPGVSQESSHGVNVRLNDELVLALQVLRL